jgi:DNA-binding XRE family transcriptional regulator
MSVQIVEIAGQKMALLPVADYERLLDLAEDKADALAAADAEHRRESGEEYLSGEMVDRLMSGESALRVWRRHRGLTLSALAERAGVTVATLSRVETGKMQGRPTLWRSLADCLGVSVEEIFPD